LDDAESNLLVRCRSSKPVGQEWGQVLNVLVSKRLHGLWLPSNQASQDSFSIFDDHASKYPGHHIGRYPHGVGSVKGAIGKPFHIDRTAFGFMDRDIQLRPCRTGGQCQGDSAEKNKRTSRMMKHN
jgi:hypothetical protein